MVNIWTPERNIAASPYMILTYVVISIVVLLWAPTDSFWRYFGAFALPFLALVGGFTTVMALSERPHLQEKHPRMKRVHLLLMAAISLYLMTAVLLVLA